MQPTVRPTAAPPPPPGSRVEDHPTLRLPTVTPTTTPPPPARLDPITTPPPLGELHLSGSGWSDWDDADAARPPGRRAPRVGDTLHGFELVAELGRGAFARVFLARQAALAGREVALKVTLRPTREAERLARLRHTNVVPVYSVHGDGAAQLICMPYLGRVTIADLLRAHRADRSSRAPGRKTSVTRAGRTTLDSKSTGRSDGRPAPARPPAWTWASDGPPPIVGDPHAVVQALAQLADGLAHAHARGILHLDLKPANVLLADTGEPMLLDFNLSFDAARPDRDVVGGTVPYMAIEQLLDLRDRGSAGLDERTDLYALGVMAFEMLTGELPFPGADRGARGTEAQIAARRQGPPPVRGLNPAVSPAVEAIVRKLLAPDPADRYQTADQLKTDLDRHLSDLPLVHARERSLAERLGKWRRRNPGLAVRLMAACLIGLALGLGGVVHQRAEATARAGAVEQARAARAGLDGVRIDLILTGDPLARARGMKRAGDLLAPYGLPADADWQARPAVRNLPPAERAALLADLGELMFLLAHARWRDAQALPASDREAAAKDAWALNRAARGCFAPDDVPPAVDRHAAALAPHAGEAFAAPDLPAPDKVAGARARFLEAALLVQAGRYATAVPLLEAAVGDQQGHGPAQLCLACALHQLGQHARALERYDVARVLLPADPRPSLYRGIIFGIRRQPGRAEAEFTRALALDPESADAYRNRGVVRYRLAKLDQGRPGRAGAARAKLEQADKDYTAALQHGGPALQLHLLRAEARDGRDPDGARADREAARRVPPRLEMDYLVRGWALVNRDPKAALADLRKAAEVNPWSLMAYQNQAHVLAEKLNDLPGALAACDRAVALSPEYAPARSGRAVVLARLGRRADAHKEIEKAQLLSDDADVAFHAACVYALTSRADAGDRAKAVAHLKLAVRNGFTDLDKLGTDPDLDPVRELPEFQAVQRAATDLLK